MFCHGLCLYDWFLGLGLVMWGKLTIFLFVVLLRLYVVGCGIVSFKF